MSIKDIIEQHPVVIFIGALITGFGVGISSYKTVVDITGQVLVTQSAYMATTARAEKVTALEGRVTELEGQLAAALEENQWYVIVASVTTSDEARKVVGELKKKGLDGRYLLKDGSTHIAVFVGEQLPRKKAMALLLRARNSGYRDAYIYPQNFVAEKDK